MRQQSNSAKDAARSRQGHPAGDAQAIFGRGENPHVLERLRGEDSIAELCRREGIAQKPLLSLIERLSGGWQEAPGR